MNLTKLLLANLIVLGLGLTSCSNDDDISSSGGEEKNNTNVSVTLKLSQQSSDVTTKSTDYNSIGEWAGKDKIETVAIYLVDGNTVSINNFTVGSDEKDGYTQALNPKTNEVVLTPTKAIKTTVGIKKVYVLINGKTDVIKALDVTDASTFEAKYKSIALSLGNSGAEKFTGTSADNIATKSIDNETIVMTNTSDVTINVAANVTAAQALETSGALNRVSVGVARAVARVMVTTKALSYDISSGATILGSISDISWVLAQGESSLYIQRQSNWFTPNYLWVPKTNAEFTETHITGKDSKYDYSGLFEGYDSTTKFGGTTVATLSDYYKIDGKIDTLKITKELNDKLSGKFILPNMHQYGIGVASSYKKGNTAYVLIRAKFTPRVFADGGTYKKGDDFYVGANGKFYTTAANAVDLTKGGIVGQTVAKYVGGKVLYYAWVNPDVIPAWYNSPVLRNNIYHVHITGFKNLGTNWNPLFPEDPNNPKGDEDPNNPGKKLPLNPDPKPSESGVTEPVNPIDPTDPLTTPETWMSVDVKILPWQLHSYAVDLGI